MKIALYSYSSMKPAEGEIPSVITLPKFSDLWDQMAAKYPEHEFVVVSNMPSVYLTGAGASMDFPSSDKVKYKISYKFDCSIEEMAEAIIEEKPDLAIAASCGYFIDWIPVGCSMIAEILEKNGIKTIAQRTFISIGAFDKWRTQILLRTKHIKVSKGIYIHDEMFWVEESRPTEAHNIYKDYVMLRVKELNYPVIIKDTLGSGSMGIQICQTYDEAKSVLTDKRNGGDLMVEELIQGVQFGTEIHGNPGNYCVLPPVIFSTNKDGITDPYQSVKLGPVTNEKYEIKKLQKMLLDMAEELQLSGITQVDLVFKDGEWYVIEINPRISGMTSTVAAIEGMDRLELLIKTGVGLDKDYSDPANLKYAANFKLVNPTEDIMSEIMAKYPCVKNVFATIASAYSYCEIVVGGFDTKEELYDTVSKLIEDYKDVVSPIALSNLKELCDTI